MTHAAPESSCRTLQDGRRLSVHVYLCPDELYWVEVRLDGALQRRAEAFEPLDPETQRHFPQLMELGFTHEVPLPSGDRLLMLASEVDAWHRTAVLLWTARLERDPVFRLAVRQRERRTLVSAVTALRAAEASEARHINRLHLDGDLDRVPRRPAQRRAAEWALLAFDRRHPDLQQAHRRDAALLLPYD